MFEINNFEINLNQMKPKRNVNEPFNKPPYNTYALTCVKSFKIATILRKAFFLQFIKYILKPNINKPKSAKQNRIKV